ncbi:MAG TPA: DUF4389 domain-containing protein [Streptosporangiaceae bacterium]|nr:DUF4389 domain-containing protein [Streptosporangiaceae bacterium]
MSQPFDPAWAAQGVGAETQGGGWSGPPGGRGPGDGYGGPGGSGPSLFGGPAPVLISFAPPARQSRLAIAFRLLLAIPHLIILWALGVAAEVVVIIGWFAALFTGSLPDWAHTFLTGVLRWQVRVYAYMFFLTGTYPPFSLEDERFPVRLVSARVRLNRLAVFFRLILVIPAAIVAGIAMYGLAVVSFFCWLIALVGGRLPTPLHQALAAIVRLQARYYGYVGMVTGDYPWWGLFGDPVSVQAAAALPASDAGYTPAAAADPWKLPLSGAAKGIVWGVLALGLAAAAGAGVAEATGGLGSLPNSSAFSNARSLVVIEVAYGQLSSSSTTFESAVRACGQLSCVTAEDHKEATALRAFASSVSSAHIAGSAAADASTLTNDATGAAQSLDKLAASTSVAQYQSQVSGSPLQQQLNSLDSDYTRLVTDLRA